MNPTSHGRYGLARLFAVALAATFCLAFGAVSNASAATFDPEAVISDSNMRDYDSMSVSDIQAFLEAQTGSLADLKTADYDKVITLSKTKSNVNSTPDKGEAPKPASRIIWEACRAWKISPKVMLTMLQKEQSLLTRKPAAGSSTLARAIGAGCPGSLVDPKNNPVATNRYPGFGNQVWHGARLLSSYGEGNLSFPVYYAGISKTIYKIDGKTHIHPKNLATFKLYVYNPSIGATMPYADLAGKRCSGNANFWLIYRRYFGDTFANPRMREVFRFRNRSTGSYLYTTSVTERYHLGAKHPTSWEYIGPSFSVDTSVSAASTVPMYRFYNTTTHKYSFTRSKDKYEYRRSKKGRKTWTYGGVAFRVSAKATPKSVTVYRMHNKRTGAYLLTSSKSTTTRLRKTAALRRTWAYEGVAFYLPRLATP